MIGPIRSLESWRLCLAAALACFLPAAADAQTLYISNETPITVVVQASTVIRGVPMRDRQIVLGPKDVTNPGITLPGNKIIIISDYRNPNRIYCQGAIPACDTDQSFAIVIDGPGRMRLEPRRR